MAAGAPNIEALYKTTQTLAELLSRGLNPGDAGLATQLLQRFHEEYDLYKESADGVSLDANHVVNVALSDLSVRKSSL